MPKAELANPASPQLLLKLPSPPRPTVMALFVLLNDRLPSINSPAPPPPPMPPPPPPPPPTIKYSALKGPSKPIMAEPLSVMSLVKSVIARPSNKVVLSANEIEPIPAAVLWYKPNVPADTVIPAKELAPLVRAMVPPPSLVMEPPPKLNRPLTTPFPAPVLNTRLRLSAVVVILALTSILL